MDLKKELIRRVDCGYNKHIIKPLENSDKSLKKMYKLFAENKSNLDEDKLMDEVRSEIKFFRKYNRVK